MDVYSNSLPLNKMMTNFITFVRVSEENWGPRHNYVAEPENSKLWNFAKPQNLKLKKRRNLGTSGKENLCGKFSNFRRRRKNSKILNGGHNEDQWKHRNHR